jgi:hypothetical protein
MFCATIVLNIPVTKTIDNIGAASKQQKNAIGVCQTVFQENRKHNRIISPTR